LSSTRSIVTRATLGSSAVAVSVIAGRVAVGVATATGGTTVVIALTATITGVIPNGAVVTITGIAARAFSTIAL
jgi:hypothetical protein